MFPIVRTHPQRRWRFFVKGRLRLQPASHPRPRQRSSWPFKRREKEVYTHYDPARSALLIGGLPESAARAAEQNGTIDWRPLAAALDTLYMATGGGLGVRRFWMSPHEALSGRAPLEVIARHDGPRLVAHAAYLESSNANSAKIS